MSSRPVRATTAALLILTAASQAAQGQGIADKTANIAQILPSPAPVACLIDAAFGYGPDTPRLCFRTSQETLNTKTFWTGFEEVVPAPTSIDDLSAAFEIRSGTGLIGETEITLGSEAMHMISTCWARIEDLQHRGQAIPASPCVQ